MEYFHYIPASIQLWILLEPEFPFLNNLNRNFGS